MSDLVWMIFFNCYLLGGCQISSAQQAYEPLRFETKADCQVALRMTPQGNGVQAICVQVPKP